MFVNISLESHACILSNRFALIDETASLVRYVSALAVKHIKQGGSLDLTCSMRGRKHAQS